MDESPKPVTRRELRRRASVPPPAGRPLTRRDVRTANRRPSSSARLLEAASRAVGPRTVRGGRHAASARAGHGRARQWSTVPGPVPALGLLVAVLVMVTGVGVVHADLDAQLRDATAAAIAREEDRRERADAAAVERLTAEAAAFAADRRAEAMSIAIAALEKAETVSIVAADVVDSDTITPLEEAMADLSQLVGSSPAPSPAPTPIDTADVEPVENDADDEPTTAVGDADAVVETSEAPAASRTRSAGAAPAPEALLPDGQRSDLAPRPRTSADRLQDLDLGVTEQMLAVAAQLDTLADEVEAVAVAEIAAAEEAAAERAARRAAAAKAAADELARRIAAVDAAPNGAVPRDLLCGVDFTSGVLLRCDAAAALEELNVAYRAHFGRDLTVVSSYRDLPTQRVTKERQGDLAATPGTSQHGRGVAVDFSGFGRLGDFTKPSYLWMTANAERFGWTHPPFMGPNGRGPHEPWHWEYQR